MRGGRRLGAQEPPQGAPPTAGPCRRLALCSHHTAAQETWTAAPGLQGLLLLAAQAGAAEDRAPCWCAHGPWWSPCTIPICKWPTPRHCCVLVTPVLAFSGQVYDATFRAATRDLAGAADLFLESIATFTSCAPDHPASARSQPPVLPAGGSPLQGRIPHCAGCHGWPCLSQALPWACQHALQEPAAGGDRRSIREFMYSMCSSRTLCCEAAVRAQMPSDQRRLKAELYMSYVGVQPAPVYLHGVRAPHGASEKGLRVPGSSLTVAPALLCSTELFTYETCIFYTVLAAVPTLDRVRLKSKVVDAPEILTVIDAIPHLTTYLNALYECRYAEFFQVGALAVALPAHRAQAQGPQGAVVVLLQLEWHQRSGCTMLHTLEGIGLTVHQYNNSQAHMVWHAVLCILVTLGRSQASFSDSGNCHMSAVSQN